MPKLVFQLLEMVIECKLLKNFKKICIFCSKLEALRGKGNAGKGRTKIKQKRIGVVLKKLFWTIYCPGNTPFEDIFAEDIICQVNDMILLGWDNANLTKVRNSLHADMIVSGISIDKCYTRNICETSEICCGRYCVNQKYECGTIKRMYAYTILLKEHLLSYVQIALINSEKNKKEIKVKLTNQGIQYIDEKKLLYAEAYQGRVIWHLETGRNIESVDTLEHIQNEFLTEDFVKIHRSYIVNKLHVLKIERCKVQMKNGDILPIPCKKYTMVRQKLTDER